MNAVAVGFRVQIEQVKRGNKIAVISKIIQAFVFVSTLKSCIIAEGERRVFCRDGYHFTELLC